ncbi:MAG: phage holin family protein [Patescibacteria group bacterium]
MSLKRFISQLIAAILGLYLASRFIPSVQVEGGLKILLMAGAILGVLNYFVKPILKLVSLPLRILTLGLFSFIINMALVWGADILFPGLIIKGIWPLFLTSLIVWGLGILLGLFIKDKH